MRIFHLFLLGLCLALFTHSATTDLTLPGPQADESAHACLTIDLMRPPHPLSRDYTLRFGDQPFPFGVDAHTGALKAYLLWPFFAMFGPSVALLRLFTVSLGLLTLLFFYLFVRELSGDWAAFWAMFSLSLHAAFIFYSKLEGGQMIDQLLWMLICLWGFTKWGKTEKKVFLLIGFTSGLFGIYSHVTFIWFLVAGSISVLIFHRGKVLKGLKSAPFFAIPVVGLSAAVFLYWVVGERETLSKGIPGAGGMWGMFERLSTKGGILPDVLFGDLSDKIIPLPGIDVRPLTDFFLALSFLFLLLGFRSQTKAVQSLLVLSSAMFFEQMVTPGGSVFYSHRMMPFYLFLVLFSGIVVSESLSFFKAGQRRLRWKFLGFGLLLLGMCSIWGQVTLKQEADQEIRRTGGKGRWSGGVYTLSKRIEEEGWDKVVCLRWGLIQPLFLLTEGKVLLETPHWRSRTSVGRWKEALSRFIRESSSRTLFILNPEHSWREEIARRAFFEAIQEMEKKSRLEYIVYDREGDPLYAAYAVHDAQE